MRTPAGSQAREALLESCEQLHGSYTFRPAEGTDNGQNPVPRIPILQFSFLS